MLLPVTAASAFIIFLIWSPESTSTVLPTIAADSSVLKLTFTLPFAPFLVVIINTPFDALEPYNAVADASFKTLIDSMSLGLIVFRKFAEPDIPLLSTGTPSITINGSLLAFKEAPPRMRILLPPPADPPLVVTCKPATLPCNNCSEELICPF